MKREMEREIKKRGGEILVMLCIYIVYRSFVVIHSTKRVPSKCGRITTSKAEATTNSAAASYIYVGHM